VNLATDAAPLGIALDHLVVACRTLAAGRAWCEATFGVAPESGGRHPLMGTHNALLRVASPRFPRAYLELIAIDPEAPAPGRPRWFNLDAPSLQTAIGDEPRLVHWVARCADIDAASASLREAGFDLGHIVNAERMTTRGLLRWRITVPDDGGRPAGGAVPLLIEWGDVHPADSLPTRGVAIESLQVGGIDGALAKQLGVELPAPATSALSAVLAGPRGRVILTAPTLAAS
jgi:Glyoxalase-like domain